MVRESRRKAMACGTSACNDEPVCGGAVGVQGNDQCLESAPPHVLLRARVGVCEKK